MHSKIKQLKDGRFKFALNDELREVLVKALAACLHFDGEEMEDYLFALLRETLDQLQEQEQPKLQRSQVLAMMRYTGSYIDEPTQLVILDLLTGGKPLLSLSNKD